MTWLSVPPEAPRTGLTVFRPFVWALREEWTRITEIDEMSSDLRTLDFLSMLILFIQPKIIVEVGTYRGLGAATFAEVLRTYELPGHVYTCDPLDFEAPQFFADMGLADRITYHKGTLESLIREIPGPLDFCYVDGAAPGDLGGRLRYAKLALLLSSPNAVVAVDDAAGDWKGAKTLAKQAKIFLPQHRGIALFQRR